MINDIHVSQDNVIVMPVNVPVVVPVYLYI
jgi:hypothetical protein